MATAKKTASPHGSARKVPVRKAPAGTPPVDTGPAAAPVKKMRAATPAASSPRLAPAPSAANAPAPADKLAKARKPKLIRDSFTIPKSEYLVLETLKQRAAKAGAPAKKSELLRAGIKALAEFGDTAFLKALGAVPAIKTGRPPQKRASTQPA